MKTRKMLAFAACAVLLIAALCATAFAAEVVDSGTCGENVTWTLDSDGLLTISGTGEMTSSPWRDNHKDDIKHVVISDGVTSIGNSAFWECKSLTSVTIPDSVTTIEYNAFGECTSLTSIMIPDNVAEIGDLAFYGCTSLTSVTIPDKVKRIGMNTFGDCTSLSSVTMTNGVETIDMHAFFGCTSLTNVTMPNSVETIGISAFNGCTSLKSITIPSSVTTIELYAFANCTSLTEISVDDNNPNYSSDSFGVLFNKTLSDLICAPGAIVEYTIPNSVTTIVEYGFYGCTSLTNVTIPNSVETIGEYAFHKCTSLTGLTIPNSVTKIDDFTFSYCKSLTSVTIPNSVTHIYRAAFYESTSIKDVYYEGSEEQWNKISISGYNEPLTNATIHFIGILEAPFDATVSDVTVSAEAGVVPAETELIVTASQPLAVEIDGYDTANAVAYDISLVNDGETIQPNGEVAVSIPVPEGMDGEKCKVFFIDGNTAVDMNAVFANGVLTFTTTHFSVYEIVQEIVISPHIQGDIIADTVTAFCGEGQTADVNISYVGEGEISSVRMAIDSALPIADITSNYEFEYNEEDGWIIIWAENGANFGESVLLTLHYDLDVDPAYDDGEYAIGIELIEVTDEDEKLIELTSQNGAVIIENPIKLGDVNMDGVVDNRDIIMIARYLVSLVRFDDDQTILADFNCDGTVNNTDLVLVSRYIVGLA